MPEAKDQYIVNLAAKMDARTNNEFMESAPNDTGLQLVSLVNQDLFYSKSLTGRQGTVDICGGIINASGGGLICNPNMTNVPPIPGVIAKNFAVSQEVEPPELNRYGLIIVPSGNINLASGNITFTPYYPYPNNPNGTVTTGDYQLTINLYLMNQNNLPDSGVSFFWDHTTSGIHNLALNGNFNTTVLPQISGIPISISNSNSLFTMGDTFTGGFTFANPVTVPYLFGAPAALEYGNVYFMQMQIFPATSGQISGANTPVFYPYVNNTSTVDISPNTIYGEEFGTSNQITFTNLGAGTKNWLNTCLGDYQGASYILTEFPAANINWVSPLKSGVDSLGVPSPALITTPSVEGNTIPFNGKTTVPPVDTTTVEFGQVITVPSGTWNLIGAYFYATPFEPTPYANFDWQAFTRTKQPISGNGYTLGYSAFISEIVSSSGSTAAGDFVITERNILSSFSGTYIFDGLADTISGIANEIYFHPNFNQHKIYAMFPNPAMVSVTSPTQYLLSFNYYDINTGGPYTDYIYDNVGAQNAPMGQIWSSFMENAINYNGEGNFGNFVTNYSNDGQTFIQPQGDPGNETVPFYENCIDLTCGVLSTSALNAITGIYDYRASATLSQRVMFAQGKNLGFFELANPTDLTVIYSGAIVDENAKWSFATLENLLIAHQYSESPGQVWDQIYSNPSGSWTQLHGLRPSFSGSSASLPSTPSGTTISGSQFTTGIPSGVSFNVIMGTSILSGGIRASNEMTFSGTTGNTLQIFGTQGLSNGTYPYDIYHVSGLAANITSGQSQYQFDVFSNGTYVFATQSTAQTSGNNFTYFLAPLCDSSGNAYPNPMPNNNTWNLYAPFYSGTTPSGSHPGSGVFIYDITFSGANAQQVPEIIDYGQTYLLEQIDVPAFKKVFVWNNYLWGFGASGNSSTLYASQEGCPQIFGGVGDENFYQIPIDADNGEFLTGSGIFKNFLLLFKQNSTYACQYTYTAGNLLSVQQISPTKGNMSIFSTAETDYGVFGMDANVGPVLATYYGTESIADEILPYFQTLNTDDLDHSVCLLDISRQQLYFSVSNANNNFDNQTGLVYSYAEKAWGTRQGGMWSVGNIVRNANNQNLLIIGDTIGQIQGLNSGAYGDDVLFTDTVGISLTQTIDLSWTTPWLTFSNSNQIKNVESLRINCQEADQLLEVQMYFNQNMNNPITRYIDCSQPVWNRKITSIPPFYTMMLVVNTLGAQEQTKINSLEFKFSHMGKGAPR